MIFIARIIAERFLKQLFYLASTVLVFKKTLLVAMSYKATLMYQTFDMSKMLIIRACLVPKIFCTVPSHRILRHMYEVLNVDEKKLIAQLSEKSRNETFEPN